MSRYFHNKYDHAFTTVPASGKAGRKLVAYVEHILKAERDIVFAWCGGSAVASGNGSGSPRH